MIILMKAARFAGEVFEESPERDVMDVDTFHRGKESEPPFCWEYCDFVPKI